VSSAGFDPSILQDFLTESSELVEQLEADLVELETRPREADLLNRVFRALHTIKGSASFLALTNLVSVAHAAESALNAARNGVVVVDRAMMDLLLEAVDLIKSHLGQLETGAPLTEPRSALVAHLAALGEGKTARPAAVSTETHAPAAAPKAGSAHVRPLVLGAGKADLLSFLVADLDETLEKTERAIRELAEEVASTGTGLGPVASRLLELSEEISRSVEFFEFDGMTRLARALAGAAEAIGHAPTETRPQAMLRLRAVHETLREQTQGLKAGEVRDLPTATLLERMDAALRGESLAPEACLPDSAEVSQVLAVDGVTGSAVVGTTPPPATPAKDAAPAKEAARDEGDHGARKGGGDATIRVEVGRLETLMNLVGELVLQKNRISALARQHASSAGDSAEALLLAAGTLDRVTGDIQTAVMRTRMQPLEKLFGRYPRLIRDLAAKTGKKISLVIEGGETEVDKSVIEELGDPLVHLLRNSADHGVEPPQERVASGKAETSVITLRASHEGSHVRVLVLDDGRGLSRERIGRKAVERGMVTQAALDAMPDREVFRFIFAPGFSTAEQVSDLSGRGVGMDVVRTNIEKIKGTIDLTSEPGRGACVSISIPLTVAILPAMMVGVGPEIYAIPLGNILEIVKPQDSQLSSVGGHPVMRLRDSVLPLISAADLFELKPGPEGAAQTPFAVVVTVDERRVGLMVSRLIGQQEVVIKPLDEMGQREKHAVSGATVRDDGGVSLIIDVAELVRMAETAHPGGRPRVRETGREAAPQGV
jgi:two-component system chemotaxis sensor kinase CheA